MEHLWRFEAVAHILFLMASIESFDSKLRAGTVLAHPEVGWFFIRCCRDMLNYSFLVFACTFEHSVKLEFIEDISANGEYAIVRDFMRFIVKEINRSGKPAIVCSESGWGSTHEWLRQEALIYPSV